MISDGFFWFCNLVMGLCVAGAAIAGRDVYARSVDLIEHNLTGRLRSLRIAAPQLRRWIHAWLAITTVAFVLLWIGLNSFVFAVLLAVPASVAPWYVIGRLALRRRQKIELQLADAMVSFSSAIRAGLSLPQALEMLSAECPRPINQEFLHIVGDYKMGKPLEQTLAEAKDRLKSENFILFAAALLASRESGGRLNETVERISASVLELQRLERKIESETAQARKSAVYMAIVPVIVLCVYAAIDPENTALLFTSFTGNLFLATAVVLNVVAYFWALKILRADI